MKKIFFMLLIFCICISSINFSYARIFASTSGNEYVGIIIVLVICMFIYWIFLLLKYERETKVEIENLNDDEIFEKYNPLIAGCIVENREVLLRDIVAVILNLIEKGNIKYEPIKSKNGIKNHMDYIHMVSKNPQKEHEMDDIEKNIYDLFFDNITGSVDLKKRIEYITNSSIEIIKFNSVNNIAREKLNKMGANKKSVPKLITQINDGISLLMCCIAIGHSLIISDTDFVYLYTDNLIDNIQMTVLGIFSYTAIIELIKKIFGKLKNNVRKRFKNLPKHILILNTVTFFVIFIFSALFTCLIRDNLYLIWDQLLITLSLVIVFTDNLMTKGNAKMIEGYSKLLYLKNKIKYDTTINEKNLQDVVLVGKYMAYGLSFGIGKNLLKEILDIDIGNNQIEYIDTRKLADTLVKFDDKIDDEYMEKIKRKNDEKNKKYRL